MLVYDRTVKVKDGKLASPWITGWTAIDFPTEQTVIVRNQKGKSKTVSRSNIVPVRDETEDRTSKSGGHGQGIRPESCARSHTSQEGRWSRNAENGKNGAKTYKKKRGRK